MEFVFVGFCLWTSTVHTTAHILPASSMLPVFPQILQLASKVAHAVCIEALLSMESAEISMHYAFVGKLKLILASHTFLSMRYGKCQSFPSENPVR